MYFDNIKIVRRSRRTDPAASHTAAQNSVKFADGHKGRILQAPKEGPRTAGGIAAMTGLSVEQVARRMPELQDSRKVEFVKDELFNAVVVDGYRVWKILGEKA